ncbi:MAG TPA: putative quinol monooxygenase [Sphingomonadaceae bacterium]
MIAVIGHFRLPPARVAEAREPMERVIAATRAEAGCLGYSYAEDTVEPGLIRVAELWESRAHLAAHFEAPHMKRWVEERAALDLYDRQIAAYELGAPETL